MFKEIGARLAAGEELALVTIIASSGATPRGAGARMLVGREGRLCGTIGGGAVEYEAQQRAVRVIEEKSSQRQNYSLTKDDVQNLGMICGGEVEVFFHYIPACDRQTLALVGRALEVFDKGEGLWLISEVSGQGQMSLYTDRDGFYGSPCPRSLQSALARKAKVVEAEGRQFCVEQINSPGRVYVFGGGHVSQELVPLLSRVGFRCVVLEDRPEFAKKERYLRTAPLQTYLEEYVMSDYQTLSGTVITSEVYSVSDIGYSGKCFLCRFNTALVNLS